MKNSYKEYCVGCGLCKALNQAELKINEKGYYYPIKGNDKWLSNVCPVSGKQFEKMDMTKIWGREKGVFYGYSTDNTVRKIASSGGVITELAAYLLDIKAVDCILHIGMKENSPTETEICISKNRGELIKRSGSRYSISHPLEQFDKLDKNKRYAFIGKPCDVIALKNFMEIQPEIKKIIPYTMSFFCAGLPSTNAQKNLLNKLGCNQSELKSLRYRGNGWPGYTTATDKYGNEYRLDYTSSWGGILGRDIMKMCRFCIDGIGEMADISCGDAWYLNDKNEPDFSENHGRNVIFCRTDEGLDLLKKTADNGNLFIEPFKDYEEKLQHMQFYQYDRRATMWSKTLAMKLLMKSLPDYPLKSLKYYNKYSTNKRNSDIFKGTIRRILKGKI